MSKIFSFKLNSYINNSRHPLSPFYIFPLEKVVQICGYILGVLFRVKESTLGLELLKVESRINVLYTYMLLMIHIHTLNDKAQEFSRNSVAVEVFSGETFFKGNGDSKVYMGCK